MRRGYHGWLDRSDANKILSAFSFLILTNDLKINEKGGKA